MRCKGPRLATRDPRFHIATARNSSVVRFKFILSIPSPGYARNLPDNLHRTVRARLRLGLGPDSDSDSTRTDRT